MVIFKEKKVYLFDYAQIKDRSICFENIIGLELYRAILIGIDPFRKI
jgi:hypothetical protein